ncbi:MAG: ion channel [Bacteroidales bacterium]|nr:ion channel [Bacteroidales bacterium]
MNIRNRRYFVIVPILMFMVLIYIVTILEKGNPDGNIKNFSDGLWYTIVTLTTVGYGDFYPVTPAGKIVSIFIIISSLGFLGYLIGEITNLIRNYMEKKKEGFFGVNFEKHFVIVGWDSFAKQVTDQVIRAKHKVAVITNKKDDIDLIYDMYPQSKIFVLYTDFNNITSFDRAGINKASTVYINMDDDSENLVFVINMKKVYDHNNYVVTLNNPELRETYMSIGVRQTVSKTDIASKLVASYIFEPDVARLTEDFMATSVDETDYDIQEYKIVDDNEFVGADYFDAFVELKKRCNVVLLGIVKVHDGIRTIIKNPTQGVKIMEGDYLLLVSGGKSKTTLHNIFKVNEGVID